MITVLADRHHYQLKRFLHPSLRLMQYDPIAGWTADQVREADVLLVRTTNPVNSTTLPENSRVRFVATASAGRDHLDEAWLNRLGITVADAKGSNARSVAEYVAVSLLASCDSFDMAPSDLTAGVVGAGFTGSATTDLLGKLGVTCILHDPPREERELAQGSESDLHANNGADRGNDRTSASGLHIPDTPFRSVSLEQVLECDILTLHVPLERSGTHATWHWLDETKLAAAPKKLVINASRGGVMDERALLAAQELGKVRAFVCDVWEGEPVFSDITARQAFMATPHIAGYSIEAKRNASEMMCTALHRFLGLQDPEPPVLQPHPEKIPDGDLSLRRILGHLHPAFSYDADLRRLIGRPDAEKGPAFLRLRQETPLRHEFAETGLDADVLRRHPVLAALGFRSIETDTP